jgi:hypothetical protein
VSEITGICNLKEKFFEKISEMYIQQLPETFKKGIQANSGNLIPFRFWLDHDKGLSKIVVFSSDE